MSQYYQYDVLIIGSGAAGLTTALTLPRHLRIAVLSKGDLSSGSTYWAQGGVAAESARIREVSTMSRVWVCS